jgi:hypothetical protein
MIIYIIMNMTDYDYNYKHKHDYEGHIEPKPLIFKARLVL